MEELSNVNKAILWFIIAMVVLSFVMDCYSVYDRLQIHAQLRQVEQALAVKSQP